MPYRVRAVYTFLMLCYLSSTLISCKGTSIPDDDVKIDKIISISVSYTKGSGVISERPIIYAIWLENTSDNFIQNMYICNRLLDGSLTNTALPFWQFNRKSQSTDIDAVTGATVKNQDFTVTRTLKNNNQKYFTVCFEIDRSFDTNDWFSNQPSILYKVDVDLDDVAHNYTMTFTGWTPNEGTENIIPATPKGVFQTEKRYITHTKSGDTFGVIDSRSATNLVGTLTVDIEIIQ